MELVLGEEGREPHACHWPGCGLEVQPAMWGCKRHWFTLPKALRDQIWAAYRPGQEKTKDPSPAYLQAAENVQLWIRGYLSTPGKDRPTVGREIIDRQTGEIT